MNAILTQWDFHRVKEHPNRNSDEEVMTFRSWRSHMTNCLTWAAYLSWPDGHFRPPPTPTSLPSGPVGKLTQWAFHEVQEHPNQSSNEGDMTFRSWRSCVVNFDEHCSCTTPVGRPLFDEHCSWTTPVGQPLFDDHCSWTTPVGRSLFDDHCSWTTPIGRPLFDDHCSWTTPVGRPLTHLTV